MLSGRQHTSKDFGGCQMNDEIIPVLVGGLSDKLCNKGTQFHFQDRVYSSESVSVSVTTAFHPWYLVKNEKICSHIKDRKK